MSKASDILEMFNESKDHPLYDKEYDHVGHKQSYLK